MMPTPLAKPTPPNAKPIWIASMPRSGSMWAFNVTRELVKAAGCRAVPERIPQTDEDMVRHAVACLQDPDPSSIAVLKIHSHLQEPPPASRFIITHRDLRDALVSWQRFMQCDFDRALEATSDSAKTCDHYRSFPADLTLHVKYEDIRDHALGVIRDIGGFLGLAPSETEVDDIHERFRKENVANRINATEAGMKARSAKGDTIAEDEIVRLGPGNIRAFDVTSGFQSGHVSGYRDGDWRDIFSAGEKARIRETLGDWLVRNGYPPE